MLRIDRNELERVPTELAGGPAPLGAQPLQQARLVDPLDASGASTGAVEATLLHALTANSTTRVILRATAIISRGDRTTVGT
mmetsp:Transcript_37237/g.81716  ORF Transcript_37237/g.81716 Transcript_37237/m.81716 type:complete len:82 (+) Transcript_37237:1-246(+)